MTSNRHRAALTDVVDRLGVNVDLSFCVASCSVSLLISATNDLIISFEEKQDISVPIIAKELKGE